MNYRKEGGSRETWTLSPGLLTMIVKIRLKHVKIVPACAVLRGIVDSTKVHDWERRNGRHRISRRDIVLCLLVKAYLNVSYRRLTGFLRVLRPRYGLSRIPHFNTLAAYNRMPSMEGTLKSSLGHTAEGAWKEESVIAIDSSNLLLHG